MRWKRVLLIAAAVSAAAVTAYMAVVIYAVVSLLGPPAVSFDSARWKAEDSTEGHPSLRYRMLRDLETKLHPGMTRAEVGALLGGAGSGYSLKHEYGLGFRWLGMDYDSLVVEFDDKGRLVRYYILPG
jgi:hypothetical protein